MRIVALIVQSLALLALTFMAGCKTVDPGQAEKTGLGEVSNWGIPMMHVTTAGFNGSPSEMNGTGPVAGSPAK